MDGKKCSTKRGSMRREMKRWGTNTIGEFSILRVFLFVFFRFEMPEKGAERAPDY